MQHIFHFDFIQVDPSFYTLYLIRKCPLELNFQFLPLHSFRKHIHKERPFSSTLLVQITSIKQMSSFLSLKLFFLGLGQCWYWWLHRKDSLLFFSPLLSFPHQIFISSSSYCFVLHHTSTPTISTPNFQAAVPASLSDFSFNCVCVESNCKKKDKRKSGLVHERINI